MIVETRCDGTGVLLLMAIADVETESVLDWVDDVGLGLTGPVAIVSKTGVSAVERDRNKTDEGEVEGKPVVGSVDGDVDTIEGWAVGAPVCSLLVSPIPIPFAAWAISQVRHAIHNKQTCMAVRTRTFHTAVAADMATIAEAKERAMNQLLAVFLRLDHTAENAGHPLESLTSLCLHKSAIC